MDDNIGRRQGATLGDERREGGGQTCLVRVAIAVLTVTYIGVLTFTTVILIV